jgi:hypothetical protein
VTTDLVLDLTLLAAILGTGGLAARALLGRWDAIRLASLALPLGAGAVTFLAFLASWLGIRLELSTVAILLAGIGGISGVAIWKLGRETEIHSAENRSPATGADSSNPWLLGILVALAFVAVGANIYLSIARSYSLWDSIAIWSVKGYGIALEGSIFAAREWGGHGLAYPLNIPILISLFRLAGGDVLPTSKAVFPLFYASLLVGVFGFLRAQGMRREVAGLGALALASIPVLFTESTTGYTNAALTVYLLLGTLSLLEGARTSSRRDYLLGGSLLGLACWTRVEGGLYVGAILVSGMAALAIFGRVRLRWGWTLLPLAIVLVPWLVFYRLYGAASSQAIGALSAALEAVRHGQFHLGALRLVLREVALSWVDWKAWGLSWLLAGLLVILGYHDILRAERARFLASMAVFFAVVSVTVLLFYVGSFGTGDLRGWLGRSFERELLPAPVFFLTGALLLLAGNSPSADRELGDHPSREHPKPARRSAA